MFSITDSPIMAETLKRGLAHPEAGALADFEGWVRNHNDGRAVASLEYEVYAQLAQREGEQILAEAKKRFDLIDVRCAHRVGHLQIGELAVWVGATAKHRDAAFKACRFVIDQVKSRVPIWKKEHYVEGVAEWVNCTGCAAHAHTHHDDEATFYERQTRIPQVGPAGQAALKQKAVLVVGAGGLGCPALSYLAAAGVGTIGICDDDQVEISNLHRQVLFTPGDAGRPKVNVAVERLAAQNPFIRLIAHPDRMTAANVEACVKDYDVVLDCTDNFASKFMLHDACFLAGVPLVQAAIYQFEGQLQVFRPRADAGCLRCLWPTEPAEGCVGTCADVGVIGVVPGVIGAMQACEAIKVLLDLPGVADRETVLMDLASIRMNRIQRLKNADCPLCGATPKIHSIDPEPEVRQLSDDWELDLATLPADRIRQFEIVDIRSPMEREGNPEWILKLRHVPANDFEGFLQLEITRDYLLVCAHGIRSRFVTSRLRASGRTRFYSLRQGIESLEPLLSPR